MATAMASIKLANDVGPAISSAWVSNIMHFKNCQIPLVMILMNWNVTYEFCMVLYCQRVYDLHVWCKSGCLSVCLLI
jgi:hypothetical protein